MMKKLCILLAIIFIAGMLPYTAWAEVNVEAWYDNQVGADYFNSIRIDGAVKIEAPANSHGAGSLIVSNPAQVGEILEKMRALPLIPTVQSRQYGMETKHHITITYADGLTAERYFPDSGDYGYYQIPEDKMPQVEAIEDLIESYQETLSLFPKQAVQNGKQTIKSLVVSASPQWYKELRDPVEIQTFLNLLASAPKPLPATSLPNGIAPKFQVAALMPPNTNLANLRAPNKQAGMDSTPLRKAKNRNKYFSMEDQTKFTPQDLAESYPIYYYQNQYYLGVTGSIDPDTWNTFGTDLHYYQLDKTWAATFINAIKQSKTPAVLDPQAFWWGIAAQSEPPPMTGKPVIYLYPQQQTSVNVRVDFQGEFSKTIPSYPEGGWNVIAAPSGQITDLRDGSTYPYLFWEGFADRPYSMPNGFVIAGSDTRSFLSGALATQGLTETEAAEFLDYWVPRMQENPYNFIHFTSRQEYDSIAPLTVTPAPDSILRIHMAWKPLQENISVPVQTLPSFERKGFVVVEWGGTELTGQHKGVFE